MASRRRAPSQEIIGGGTEGVGEVPKTTDARVRSAALPVGDRGFRAAYEAPKIRLREARGEPQAADVLAKAHASLLTRTLLNGQGLLKPRSQGRVLLDLVAQKRPTGASYPVSEEWRDKVRARMAELGMTQSDLARAIRTSPATITHLLSPKRTENSRQSRHVLAIHKVLGWSKPDLPEDSGEQDPQATELLDAWESMSDKDKEFVLELARKLRR